MDHIRLELAVKAVQMKQKFWMEGELEIYINGEKPYSDSDVVEYDQFLESLENDGEYFIFSCACGIPECGGWSEKLKVTHKKDGVHWQDPNLEKHWVFDVEKIKTDLKAIQKKAINFKKFFKKKDIEYLGIGYNW